MYPLTDELGLAIASSMRTRFAICNAFAFCNSKMTQVIARNIGEPYLDAAQFSFEQDLAPSVLQSGAYEICIER